MKNKIELFIRTMTVLSILPYGKLSIVPIVQSITIAVIWLFTGHYLSGYEENHMIMWLIELIVLFYILVGALALANSWERAQKLKGFKDLKDENKFFAMFSNGMPAAIYCMMGWYAGIIIFLTFTIEFKTTASGMFMTGIMSFILFLFRRTLFEVTDILGGAWIMDLEDIDKEWKEKIKKHARSLGLIAKLKKVTTTKTGKDSKGNPTTETSIKETIDFSDNGDSKKD
jgi:hypothetical protein